MDRHELQQLIDASGLRQQDVAEDLGVSDATISYYLQGKRTITEEFAVKAKPYLIQKAEERLASIKKTVKAAKLSPKEYFEQLAERGGYMPEKTAEEIVEEIRGSRVGAVLHTPEDATP